MKGLLTILSLCVCSAAVCSTEFVRSPMDQIRTAMKLAHVSTSDVLYDLGSGDGAVVVEASKLAQRAVGIEIQHSLVEKSRKAIRGLRNARIIEGDIFKTSLSDASVVYINLPCAKDAVAFVCKAAPKVRVLVTGNQIYPAATQLKHVYSMEGGVSLFRCQP